MLRITPMVVVERRGQQNQPQLHGLLRQEGKLGLLQREEREERRGRLFTFPTKTKQTAVQSGKIFSLILFLFCRNLIKYMHQFNSSDNVTNLFDPLILIFC